MSRVTMEIRDKYLVINNITKDELDLDKTLNCGQAFRWHKDIDNNWIGVVYDQIWILKQYENYISTNLSEQDKERLIYYFNLDMDYTAEINKLNLDSFARKSYEYSKGIHILRQELFETMVTFLMSSCNTMRNIRNIIDKLCKAYGDKLVVELNGKTYMEYGFPSLEVLSKISEEEFKQLGMGFRAAYLFDLCKMLNNNTQLINDLYYSNYVDSINRLCKINGIGKKIANCISLFALHNINAFPIDTHINQIIQSEYNGVLDITRYENHAGIIQQYMFYYKAFNK